MICVYIDAAADLFHIGHLNLIRRAKELGDYLIVGVHSDKDVSLYKREPIINERDRYEIVKSCRYVDKVIEGAPLIITESFLKKYEIDLVVHGDDVSESLKKQHKIPLEKNIVKYIPYTKGTSTAQIISKIKDSIEWENIWQNKALEKPLDLRKINGWENTKISPLLTTQIIKNRLNFTLKDSILEVGCGCGFLAEFLKKEVKEYTGSDQSQNMVNLAKSIFDCKFVCCEASSLPFKDNEFDYVIAYSVFQYFCSHGYVNKTISEMKRVAKKGIYIGDLPLESHEKNHLLYKQEQFDNSWSVTKGTYTEKRFDVHQKWDKNE